MIAQLHADTMNMVLKNAVENGTGNAARLYGREVAGKIGTTSDYTDARFVGYTTNLVTSVWMGDDNPKKKLVDVRGLAGVSGGSLPAQIWRESWTWPPAAGPTTHSHVRPSSAGWC